MDETEEFMQVASGAKAALKSEAEAIEETPAPVAPPLNRRNSPARPSRGSWRYSLEGEDCFRPVIVGGDTLSPGVYVADADNAGIYFKKQSIPMDDLVLLPDGRSKEVVEEIRRFWTLKETFAKYGFIHKRGFLLWGPPGSGKTSTLAFVVKELVRAGGVVFYLAGNPNFNASAFQLFRQAEPDRPCIVVMEDIDATIEQYGEQKTLAMLDGEASIGNVVYVATTNYPENLDGRVVNRPSRFDRVVKIGMPSTQARAAYLKSRNLGLSHEELERWAEATEGFSIAHLKEVVVGVLCLGQSFEDVVDRLRKMVKLPTSDERGKVGFGG